MNKLSKDKRDKLILVCIAVIGVLGGLYTFVLGAQKAQLATLHNQINGLKNKLSKAETSMRNAERIEASLAASQVVIGERQQKMAPPGQYYVWFLKLVDQFREDEKLDDGFIMDITQPEFVEAGLLPEFPYKAASFGLRLNGRFHEVGKFIADLENRFPYFRVQNLRLSPQGGDLAASASKESLSLRSEKPDGKLIVEVRIVTLLKPGTT